MKKMLALIIILVMLLSGCLSPTPIDACGYVVTVGIDRGKEKKYFYTLALQRAMSEQNIDSEGGAAALCAEGDSIFEAVNEIEGNTAFTLNFSRASFIIVSREIAETGELKDFVSTSFDALKIRTSAVVLVSEKEASEFIGGMYANNEANIGKLQSALMLDREKTGMVSVMSVSRLIEACSDGRFDYCSAYGKYDGDIVTDAEQKKSESEGKNPLEDAEPGKRAGGLKSYVDGAALFDGWRMTGTLTREETMLLNMVTGDFENGSLTLEYTGEGEAAGSETVVLLSRGKRRISVGDDLGITAIIILEANVHQKDESVSAEDMDRWLTESLPKILEERLTGVFLKLRGVGSDAMRFGNTLVKRFPDAESWEKFGWKERYTDFMPVFSVTVRNTDKYLSEEIQ